VGVMYKVFQHKEKYIVLLIFLSIIWSSLEVCSVYLLRYFVDFFSKNNEQKLLLILFLFCFFILVIECSIRYAAKILLSLLPSIIQFIQHNLFSAACGLQYPEYQKETAGKLVDRINIATQNIEEIIKSFIFSILPVFVGFILSTALIFFIHKFLGILYMTWFFLMMGITVFSTKKYFIKSETYIKKHVNFSSHLVDVFNNILFIKTWPCIKEEKKIFEESQSDVLFHFNKFEQFTYRLDIIRSIISGVIVIVIAIQVYLLSISGGLSSGDVVFVIISCLSMRRKIWESSLQLVRLLKSIGQLREAFVITKLPQDEQSEKTENMRISKGDIVFDNVSFSYGDKRVFSDLSFSVRSGEKVAFVGKNGSGKTTIIHLLLKLLKPEKGRILIDNKDISVCNAQFLRQQICYISQEQILFDRKFDQNYLQDTNLLPDEISVKKTYDNPTHLSLGEQQLLHIKRSLQKDVPIIILDEPANHLDSCHKLVLLDLIKSFTDKTVIIISHDISVVENADWKVIL
jgi:ATP-binding cassette, subfamily B, bacterial